MSSGKNFKKTNSHNPHKTNHAKFIGFFTADLNEVRPDLILFAEIASQDTKSHHLARFLVTI